MAALALTLPLKNLADCDNPRQVAKLASEEDHYGDLGYFLAASGWEGVHSTRPLVRLVRLVRVEYHSFHWYSIGEIFYQWFHW